MAHVFFMQENKFKESIRYYEPIVKKHLDNILDVTAIVLANLCVAYIMTSQNEEAEELMRRIEREEERVQYDDPDKQCIHLCIVNLVIGTLYCAKGNYEFGISRIMKSLEPYDKKLGTDTWYYAKRCFLGLAETLSKHMLMLRVRGSRARPCSAAVGDARRVLTCDLRTHLCVVSGAGLDVLRDIALPRCRGPTWQDNHDRHQPDAHRPSHRGDHRAAEREPGGKVAQEDLPEVARMREWLVTAMAGWHWQCRGRGCCAQAYTAAHGGVLVLAVKVSGCNHETCCYIHNIMPHHRAAVCAPPSWRLVGLAQQSKL